MIRRNTVQVQRVAFVLMLFVRTESFIKSDKILLHFTDEVMTSAFLLMEMKCGGIFARFAF